MGEVAAPRDPLEAGSGDLVRALLDDRGLDDAVLLASDEHRRRLQAVENGVHASPGVGVEEALVGGR